MDRRTLAIDAACLAVYLVAANPAVTGIGVHEWVGLGVMLAFLVHAALHVDWVVDTVKDALARPSWTRTGNLVLDVLIAVVFAVVAVSGLMISGAVLPALGLYAPGYYFWDPLHAVSAKALLALLLVHLVVHVPWIVHFAKSMKGECHDDRGER